MRISVAVAVACLSMTGLSIADPADAAIRKSTRIAAQGLGPALQLFAKDRDIQIVYRSDLVGSHTTGGASGELTVEEALTKLLIGTGLSFQFLGEEGVTIVPAAASAPASPSSAPSSGGDEVETEKLEEIVVTGTLIRGVAPVGSQAISISQEDIASSGASNTSELLANIPQAGVFLTVPAVANPFTTVNRPTLRNLGNPTSAAASTLVLVDGHRLPSMGLRQNSPDVDAIAPGMIERVEIITDGGSSTYGSDAVGGVMNFITRNRFDGVEAKARYGMADDYNVFDADLTAGAAWEAGSTYVSYSYSRHDALYGRDRDFVQRRDYINDTLQDTQCAPGNVIVAGVTYALPDLTAGLGNRCDNGEFRSIFPTETRHSVFVGMSLDNGGPVRFSTKAFYFDRENVSDAGPLATNVTLNPSTALGTPNPYYLSTINGQAQTASQTFQLSLAPVLGDSAPQRFSTESYGVTPSISIDLAADWQFNAFASYGVGISEFNGAFLNQATLPTAAAFGLIDPVNLTSAVNSSILATAGDFVDFGYGKNTLADVRVVVDGPLFALPAGDVRVALGGEYIDEDYAARIGRAPAAAIASIPRRNASREIAALFGEINIPVLGEGSGVHALSISASGRYDDYSDVGHTFNPKIGVDFLPVDWLTLRGNWGKSFQAPGLADSSDIQPSALNNLGSVRFPRPGTPAAAGQTQVILGGVDDQLRPQKAETYSFGFDLQPPVIDGLSLGTTYYRVKFKDQIAIIPITDPTAYAQFPDIYTVFPTQAQVDALAALATNPSVLTTLPLASIYSILDGRRRNLSAVDVQGLDFYLRYDQATNFGNVYFKAGGNYILKFESQANPNAPVLDRTDADTRVRFSTTLGADIDRFRAEVTWSHSGGADVIPSAANLNQSRVDAFDVIDVFFRYAIPGAGLLEDTSVTLNIDNVFDKDPPVYRGSGSGGGDGYANGFTLGRLFKFGVGKKF